MIKWLNRATIFSFVRRHEPVSRHQIARELDLSPTTVSSSIADLRERDLVRELGEGESSGGRRPIMLGINQEGGLVVSVDMESVLPKRILRAAALDLKGNVLEGVKYHRAIFSGCFQVTAGIVRIRKVSSSHTCIGEAVQFVMGKIADDISPVEISYISHPIVLVKGIIEITPRTCHPCGLQGSQVVIGGGVIGAIPGNGHG